MNTNPNRLAEVRSYFDNGDTHVGYRRLLDSAIETQDMDIYAGTLSFCDWYDQYTAAESKDTSGLNQQVSSLLEKISNASTTEHTALDVPKLKTEQIGKTYHSGSFSLSSVDVTLYPSQIIGLVGENGNGKTTLLRLLYGELKPDSGTIHITLAISLKALLFMILKPVLLSYRNAPHVGMAH